MTNPFNITKAVDYTDFDIEKFWVDFGETGFKDFLKPNSPKPMLIIGSKGSGKTHMLKYFSYDLQKIRFKNDYYKILEEDKYLGIFVRCSGLDSERFKGKELTDEKWVLVFGYFLDLWFAQKLVRILLDFKISEDLQSEICSKIINLFDRNPSQTPDNFATLLETLILFQKELDYNVNNIGINDGIKIEILATLGSLIFGIPKIIEEHIDKFKGVNFLYIIDEFENITKEQQMMINSLYREKQLPVTFRISGRPYAFKTHATLGSGEENVVQSEFDIASLDILFRKDTDRYREFLFKMSLKKLQQNDFNIQTEEEFKSYFEEFNVEEFYQKCTQKPNKYFKRHLKKLEESLGKAKIEKDKIDQILNNLLFNDNLLIEKAKFLAFYREWKKTGPENLMESSEKIKTFGEQYYSNRTKDNEIRTIISYFKDDLLDQLASDSQELLPSYVGIDNFIKLSSGIPRTFLNLMKESFDNSYFETGKIPFKDSKISLQAQEKSVQEASEWFFNENRIPFISDTTYSPKTILNRLANFLRDLRFSNTPPECSINLFSVDIDLLVGEYFDTFKTLQEYSYLIKSPNRVSKNSKEKKETFFINGTIAAYYHLAIARRGVCDLSHEVFDAMFDEDKESLLRDKIKNYYAPFDGGKSKNQLKLSI